jgi:GTP-binding protein HflX
VLVEDKLFATLDPTTRRVELPNGRAVLFTDTVGFIHKLPTQLVAAFRATLEEINEADLLLHVVDITHPNVQEQSATVERVLRELGAADKPMLTALNKVDLLAEAQPETAEVQEGEGEKYRTLTPEQVAEIVDEYETCVALSAAEGTGLDDLLQRVQEMLEEELVPVHVLLPYSSDGLLGLFHSRGVVEREEYSEAGVTIQGRVPQGMAQRLEPYLVRERR